ncbi:hypothetical protein FOL47_002270 [Perkinsus chesapeaki]|uniref:Rab-GAP TBC domain-containing protein n=1 Tax=Perkinsus chesapeaki TaxID=330153 RepID=A0A7J6MEN2_PERCH|nr:hypothetical protein FOL47_002270 [Perkinsus chesapeaki]
MAPPLPAALSPTIHDTTPTAILQQDGVVNSHAPQQHNGHTLDDDDDGHLTTGESPSNGGPPGSEHSSTSSHQYGRGGQQQSSSSRAAGIAATAAMAQSPHDEYMKGEDRTKAKWAKMVGKDKSGLDDDAARELSTETGRKCILNRKLANREVVSSTDGYTSNYIRTLARTKGSVKRGISNFIREQPEKFHRRARRGIPAEYRWTVWKACVSHDERFVRNVYWKLTGLGSENEQWGRAIKIDVPRTFPRDQAARTGSQLSEAHLKSLYRILVAYANLNPDVGYCQGMNFVAGLLLLVACPDTNTPPSSVEEEEVFWVFVCLMEYDGLAGFYRENFPLLGRYTHAFDELLARELPDLRDHFMDEGVQPTLYIHQWYLSIFINCLPLHTVLVLWDVIVSDGLPVILSISIALLKVLRPALMQMEFEDIVRFFKTMKTGDEKCDATVIGQLLVRLSGKVDIPDSILESLHLPYDCQDPRNTEPPSIMPGPGDLDRTSPAPNDDKPVAGVAQWLKRVSAQIDASWSELKGGLGGGASSSSDRLSSDETA